MKVNKIMVVFIVLAQIILTLLLCVDKDKATNDLPLEAGKWVSVRDMTQQDARYFYVNGMIYGGYINSSKSPRYHFLSGKYPHLKNINDDIDIVSFEMNINKDHEPYARDKKYVYYPSEFGDILFIDGYIASGEIYCDDITIEGADPYSFQYIGKGYAIDKNRMYYKGKKIEWSDSILQTFIKEMR